MKNRIHRSLFEVLRRVSICVLTFFIVLGVGTFSTIEAAGETATLESLEDALGVQLSVDSIMSAGIEDKVFAKDIYNSINSENEESAFCKYDMINEVTLLTVDDIIASAREEGLLDDDSSDADKIKVILSYYSGEISARHRTGTKIKSIKGIKVLRRATSIDLQYNNIEDIMELDRGKNFIIDRNKIIIDTNQFDENLEEHREDFYFGHANVNTEINLLDNPIHSFPKECDGRIIIVGESSTKNIDLGTNVLNFLYKPNNGKGVSTGNIGLDVKQDGESITLDGAVTFTRALPTSGKLEKDYYNSTLGAIKVDDIKRSEISMYGFANKSPIYYHSVDDAEFINMNGKNYKFSGKFDVSIYTQATVDTKTKGSVKVIKKDDRTQKLLSGARFTIYDQDNKAIDTKETDADGICVFEDLAPGTYTIKETNPPEGYLLSDNNQTNVNQRKNWSIITNRFE